MRFIFPQLPRLGKAGPRPGILGASLRGSLWREERVQRRGGRAAPGTGGWGVGGMGGRQEGREHGAAGEALQRMVRPGQRVWV